MLPRGCPVTPCCPQKQTDPRAISNPGVMGAVWGWATCGCVFGSGQARLLSRFRS